ncbi:hypothetical protein ACFZAT_20615 [Streptomyces sp. NPDC008163]|uniref:hypothetical protein n=1 Tax=Streptomyces sp. NPDC008163 TaxID=3364818 RepID=UPI0036E478E7
MGLSEHPRRSHGDLGKATGDRLIETLIDVASDGYACQVIAATSDPLSCSCTGVREISVGAARRFLHHAPRCTS